MIEILPYLECPVLQGWQVMRIRLDRFTVVMLAGVLVATLGPLLASAQSSRVRHVMALIGTGVMCAGLLWQLIDTLLDIPPRRK